MTDIYLNASHAKNPAPSINLDAPAVADLAKWAASPPAPLLAKGRVTAVFGKKCSGKSTSELFIAHAVTLGDKSFGDLGKGPVLYFTSEGKTGIPKRLAALAHMYGPRPPNSLHVIFGVNDMDGRGRALDRIKAVVQQCRPSLVIVDGTVTTFATDDYHRVAEAGHAIADLGPAVVMGILDIPGPDDPEWLDADFDEQLHLECEDTLVLGSTRNGAQGLSFYLEPAALHIEGKKGTAVYASEVEIDDPDEPHDDTTAWLKWLANRRPYVLMGNAKKGL